MTKPRPISIDAHSPAPMILVVLAVIVAAVALLLTGHDVPNELWGFGLLAFGGGAVATNPRPPEK